MNDYIKLQYQVKELKQDAHEMATQVLSLVPIQEHMMRADLLSLYGKTIANGIIASSLPLLVKYGLQFTGKKRTVNANELTADLEKHLHAIAAGFVQELMDTGTIAYLDLKNWATHWLISGATVESTATTLMAAWGTGTPPLFKDYHSRVRAAIDGFHNSALQYILITSGMQNGN